MPTMKGTGNGHMHTKENLSRSGPHASLILWVEAESQKINPALGLEHSPSGSVEGKGCGQGSLQNFSVQEPTAWTS